MNLVPDRDEVFVTGTRASSRSAGDAVMREEILWETFASR